MLSAGGGGGTCAKSQSVSRERQLWVETGEYRLLYISAIRGERKERN